MVSFTSVLIAAVAATGVTAQTTACPSGTLLCGWKLNSPPYNYPHQVLRDAAQNDDTHFIYQSIYRCSSGGTIVWNTNCASPLSCQSIPAENPNPFCRA
ncbi:hypothetical protein B0T16DRAFT_462175 [Cercophora newfieldiana]|uniref:Uncharacterized protein n=1 Tax=Cercophora newfieldiana TaxID=92897 RepID=A0AA40CKD6_9PEZI|nr:hypothetical protein B0T16DRAFT_462175 [Cercophora newfieldiana]